nr:hypothetical protein [Bacteroidota bacterium]
MDDTPQYIKDKQLEIWLSKTISQRVEQCIIDNEALYLASIHMQKQIAEKSKIKNKADKNLK